MKRYDNLYKEIITYENIYKAYIKARNGKRFKKSHLLFSQNLEENLLLIQRELTDKTYVPSGYKAFKVKDSKERTIKATAFKDRVVHHALMNIIEPIYEKYFIYHSYANRKGKGTHQAVRKAQDYLKMNKYALKCDISKYFYSINHNILKNIINEKIVCRDTMELIRKIIDSDSDETEAFNFYFKSDDLFTPFVEKRGIPIGNLTSQYFANIYLNKLDYFIKEKLRCKYYIRYVDDFVLFSNNKSNLWSYFHQITNFLDNSLRLKIKSSKYNIFRYSEGFDFLGYRIYRDKLRLRRRIVNNWVKKLKYYKKMIIFLKNYNKAKETLINKLKMIYSSYNGYFKFGDCFNLNISIINNYWR